MYRFLTCCIFGVLLAAPAKPQSLEMGISGGFGSQNGDNLSVSEFFDADSGLPATGSVSISDGVRIGGRMAFNPRAFFGHEVSYAYQHGGLEIFEGSEGTNETITYVVRAHHMYYNFVVHALPTGTTVRPFATGGGGFSSFFPPGASTFSGGGDTKFGYNYGGGIKFNLFKYGVRFDVRNHITGKPFGRYFPGVEGKLNNLEISVTFSVLFS
ncbi:MAG: outer membrane beta-barrel protein [Bryobacterales bacterium]|nr:outer membrane beta-barrel protein [Bryobacterales bacterium]